MLRTEQLTKQFDAVTAVQGLDLHVRPGEIYGFLGPNGAGKTTTIQLLLGLLSPTSGQIFLFDRPLGDQLLATRRRIGVVAEEVTHGERMTGWELVRFFADLNGVRRPESRMEALFQRLDLWPARHSLVPTYSRGMRQKLSLIRALVHAPDLLILDEPVSGLDPYGILQVREVVEEHRAAGGAVLISSHILSEIERSADRIGILHQGRLLVEDSMGGIRRRLRQESVLRLALEALPPELPASLRMMAGVRAVESEANALRITTASERDLRPEIFQTVVAHGGVLLEMTMDEMTLEEAFVTITHQNVAQLAGAA